VKQTVGAEDAIRQLQMEVVEQGNGSGQKLIEAPQQDGFEWAWLLWLNRRTVGRWVLYGIVLATIIALVLPKQYESTTQLMPADTKSGGGLGMAIMSAMSGGGGKGPGSLLGGSGGLGGVASDLLGTKDPGAVWADMLGSRSVEDRIIDRFALRKVYGVNYWEAARKILKEKTQISVDRKSGVITIVVTDRDPQRAQQIAQAYIDELDRLNASVSTSSARRERIFLEQRLQEVKHNLAEASSQFAQYASNNTVIDVDAQTKAMVEGAAALQGQLIAAQSELDGLREIYTPNNIRVRSLKARVDELRSELQKMGGSDASLDPAAASFSKSQADQLYPSIRKLPLLGVRWLDLYRETKMQQAVYGMLTEEYESAKIEEAKEIPTVKVLDSPSWPERKSAPRRTLIVLLGMMLSLMGGVVWVLGTAAWRHIDPNDPRKQLGQTVAARVVAACSYWTDKVPPIAKTKTWWKRRKASPDGNAPA